MFRNEGTISRFNKKKKRDVRSMWEILFVSFAENWERKR